MVAIGPDLRPAPGDEVKARIERLSAIEFGRFDADEATAWLALAESSAAAARVVSRRAASASPTMPGTLCVPERSPASTCATGTVAAARAPARVEFVSPYTSATVSG